MRAALLALLATLLAACGRAEQAPSEFAGCLISLEFPSDEARRGFLERNAMLLAAQATSTELVAASSPTDNRMVLLRHGDCDTFDLAHAGLEGVDEGLVDREDVDRREGLQRFPVMLGAWPAWDQNHTWQCVARVAPSEDAGKLMNAMMFGGLRTTSILGADGALFGAYDEPCSLVETFVGEALAADNRTWPEPVYCANSSLQQCGFPGEVGGGPVGSQQR